jgi:hypothetical protein
MSTAGMSTIFKDAVLRKYLRETLEDLPNNLPRYNEARLLGDTHIV